MTATTWILIIMMTCGFDNSRMVIPFPDKASCQIAATALGAQFGFPHKECSQLGAQQ